jgi:predicted RNase H-like nuclease (RuvC/YqgF family)
MPTTTDKNIVKLIETVEALQSEVRGLKTRLNTLVDDIYLTKTNLNSFKKNVAADVTYLTDRVDGDLP